MITSHVLPGAHASSVVNFKLIRSVTRKKKTVLGKWRMSESKREGARLTTIKSNKTKNPSARICDEESMNARSIAYLKCCCSHLPRRPNNVLPLQHMHAQVSSRNRDTSFGKRGTDNRKRYFDSKVCSQISSGLLTEEKGGDHCIHKREKSER